MNNNIFDYATSELSQDAFICWCANWFNDNSKPELQKMSIELMKLFSDQDYISSVNISRQFSQDVYIDNEKYALKVDVLLIINDSIAVIVEDKTNTSEHDKQINRYVVGIKYLAENSKQGDLLYEINDTRTVYLKTGFMYDEDKCVKSDVVISGEDFLDILKKYSGNSEILDSYIAKLESNIQWYVDFGNYEGTQSSFWEWNIAKHHIAQYKLMRDIFPEFLWLNRKSWIYRVYNGSSYGKPWTEMHIAEKQYPNSSDYYSVFWRIDTDDNGPYISLRFYEDFDTKNENSKARHRELYEKLSRVMRQIINDKNLYQWKDVYPGYRGNYKESSLLHIKLKDVLLDWPNERDKVINNIKSVSDDFLKSAF